LAILVKAITCQPIELESCSNHLDSENLVLQN